MNRLPGLHLLISMRNNQAISQEKRVFINTLDEMKHFQWYIADVLYDDANLLIGRSHYKGYPSAVFQSKEGVTLIDGAIYNKSDSEVKKELDRISLAEKSLSQLSENVKQFLLTTHGEFVVVKYNKEIQKCLIFNDALGRLPFYYCSSGKRPLDEIVMSREIKFIIPFLKKTRVDRLALAEYLLFGYPLGGKTLWKDIKRLPPATMTVIHAENTDFLVKKVLTWNLEPESQTTTQLREETRKLLNLFLSSSKNIAETFSEDYTHIVLLSGGLDSRSTLAGLVRAGANPIAYSFPARESQIAEKVARTLKVKHQLASSSLEIKCEDYVGLTDGLIGIGLRNLVSYLYGIRRKVGDKAILYTGDGAGWTVKPLSLRPNISNVEELLQHIIETDHIFDLDEIGSMLNLSREDLKEHLKKHIMAFPEKTIGGKFVHFKVFERGFKWMFVGEDRNRLFFWSTTPFYSVSFFVSSMRLSQRFKEHYILYRDFLSSLSPSLCRIVYYNLLIPLSIPRWLLKLYSSIFELFKRGFFKYGRARAATNPLDLLTSRRSQKGTYDVKKQILTCVNQRKYLNFLDLSRVTEITERTTNLRKLHLLATLVVYVDLTKSTFKRS